LNTVNLEHADSRLLCNTVFSTLPNVKISESGCPNLAQQCQRAKVDEKAKKPSILLKDREDHKNDEFDSMRYLFQTYLHKFIKETYLRVLNRQ
jgi:hypothetical protein